MNLVHQSSTTAAVVTDDHVGAVAAQIDYLCRRYGVLFVVTTGNIPIHGLAPPPNSPYPDYFAHQDSRLCRPGEAMLALTVGSVTDRENAGSLAPRNFPSPFTRRGPGFNGYRKPDLMACGGNYAQNWRPYDDLSVAGIGRTPDRIAYGNGTSYAAPIISRLAALAFDRIPNSTPEIVRALLIHSAGLPKSPDVTEELFFNIVGNGCPELERLFASDRWNQNYIYSGTIGFRNILRIPFYVPNSLTNRPGMKKVRVRATLAFSPETQRTLRAGYCKSNLKMGVFKRNQSNDLKAVASSAGHERVNDRYGTIVRYEKTFSRETQGGEWEIRIEQESKWAVQDVQTPFAFVISVCDPRRDNTIDIYNSIQVEAPNQFQNFLEVDQRVRS